MAEGELLKTVFQSPTGSVPLEFRSNTLVSVQPASYMPHILTDLFNLHGLDVSHFSDSEYYSGNSLRLSNLNNYMTSGWGFTFKTGMIMISTGMFTKQSHHCLSIKMAGHRTWEMGRDRHFEDGYNNKGKKVEKSCSAPLSSLQLY